MHLPDNEELRAALDGITTSNPAETHAQLLEELRLRCPHGIRVLNSSFPIGEYTCLMHAMGLHLDRGRYKQSATSNLLMLEGIFAGPDFARWLLHHRKVRRLADKAMYTGCLVFYFRKSADNTLNWRHAGLLAGPNLCVSKWGTGHVYEHPLGEVPTNYGPVCLPFESLSGDEGFQLFEEYAAFRRSAGRDFIPHDPIDD